MRIEEHIHELRTRPLIWVLRELRERVPTVSKKGVTQAHLRFRDLHAPTWVQYRTLALQKARRRLKEDQLGHDLLLSCPLKKCNRMYKRRAALSKHLQSKHHTEFAALSDTLRAQMIDSGTFSWAIPAESPFWCTIMRSVIEGDEDLGDVNEDE